MRINNEKLRKNGKLNYIAKWGIVAAVVTILYVWLIGRLGISHSETIANILGSEINDSFAIGGGLTMIIWCLVKNKKNELWLALKTYIIVMGVVQAFKYYDFYFGIAEWTHRPSGGPGGFPSGHSAQWFTLAVLLSWFFPRLTGFWFILAMLIAISRVEANLHSPLQVTVGVLWGLGMSLWMLTRCTTNNRLN